MTEFFVDLNDITIQWTLIYKLITGALSVKSLSIDNFIQFLPGDIRTEATYSRVEYVKREALNRKQNG